MKSLKNIVIVLAIVSATAIGGVAAAATSAEPLVKVVPTVRYEPPQEEVGVVVTVNRVTPKPKTIEAKVFFDREGNLDNPELLVSIGPPGKETSFFFRSEPTDEPNPSPTNGKVTETTIKVLDKTCNLTGVC